MIRTLVLCLLAGLVLAAPARAQLGDILTAPKTLIDRAIEARSARDIAKDNEIVLKVNKIMADLGTIKASTEIYEQRLLVTGIFDDKAVYDRFEREVKAVKDVKKLYWHVSYLGKDDPKRKTLIDWADALVMGKKAEGRLIGTRGVADVNFRIATDAYSTVYIIGRARSSEEKQKAEARAKDGDGVKKLVSYIDVRP
jgi:osmotically-inducible protein OsmY